jgi:septal ring factor EnvC (AmiA/AmiB activator)
MTTLYAEVIFSILAAALLGLLVGWMFSTARSRRHLKQAQEKWARKSSELEKQHASEVDDLEGRLQSASADVQKLTKQKRQLESTTQQSDTDVDRARSDAIELNSKQVELQERLNRKIREQERQIAELRGNALSATHTQSAATQPQREHPPVVEEEAYVDQLSTRIGHQRAYQNPGVTDTAPTTTEDDWHGGRHGGQQDELEDDFDATAVLFDDERADAVAAVTDNHSFTDALDATEISAPDVSHAQINESVLDDTLDDFDDATLALDEESLARARNHR